MLKNELLNIPMEQEPNYNQRVRSELEVYKTLGTKAGRRMKTGF